MFENTKCWNVSEKPREISDDGLCRTTTRYKTEQNRAKQRTQTGCEGHRMIERNIEGNAKRQWGYGQETHNKNRSREQEFRLRVKSTCVFTATLKPIQEKPWNYDFGEDATNSKQIRLRTNIIEQWRIMKNNKWTKLRRTFQHKSVWSIQVESKDAK